MSTLIVITLLVVVVLGTTVVLIQNTTSQALVLGLFGFILAVLFLLYQAPDVAMTQGVVSSLVMPILILLAIAKTRETKK